MNKHLIAGIAGATVLAPVAGLTLLPGGGAATAANRATEHFRLYSGDVRDHDLTMVFAGSGPVAGVGTAKARDDVSGDTIPITVSLPHGKVYLRAHGHFTWHPNLRACTAREHDEGTFRVVGGTGRYADAHGSGTYTERGAGIGRRAADGSCEQSFRINYVSVTASGSVHL